MVLTDPRAQAVAERLAGLPLGTFRARAQGKDWLVTRSVLADGGSEKLVARALDGSDYISLNLYRLTSGPRLRPCEMPAAKVASFVADLVVVTDGG
ncbi:MAG: hypothetical protein AAFY65_08690 [Pseudomonadota bacterium]